MSAHYVAPIAVLGAQVTLEQRYSTVRFRLDHPHRLSHLTDNESSVVEDDQSTLSVEASEDGNWLIYTSSTPATLIQLQMRAITPIMVRFVEVVDFGLLTMDQVAAQLNPIARQWDEADGLPLPA